MMHDVGVAEHYSRKKKQQRRAKWRENDAQRSLKRPAVRRSCRVF